MVRLMTEMPIQRRYVPVSLIFSCFILFFAFDTYAADLRIRILDNAGNPVSKAVVLLDTGEADSVQSASVVAYNFDDVHEVTQVDQAFVPDVLPIMVGTKVVFPNADDTAHHVFSFSEPKQFELKLMSGARGEEILFDEPGIVEIGCNIHDHMVGHIYVSETPIFERTDSEGYINFADLSEGNYAIRVWHSRIVDGERVVRIITLGAANEEITASIALKRQRSDRRRRRY